MKAFSFIKGKESTANITDITSIFNSAEKNLDIIKSNFGTSNPTQINRLLQQQEAEKARKLSQQTPQYPPQSKYNYYASNVIKPQEKAYLHFAGKVLGYKAQPEQDTFIKRTQNPQQ